MCDSSFINSVSKLQRNWQQSDTVRCSSALNELIAPSFRWTGNQQTRQFLTTYFWSLWYSLNDTWLGASSSAYKQPGALHAGLMLWIAVWLLLVIVSSFFHYCVPALLFASARLVLKRVCKKKLLRKNLVQNSFFCYLPSFLTYLPSPFPSHPGIGLHVNMEGGGHLDERWCRGVGSLLD